MWQWPNYIQYRIDLLKQNKAQRAFDKERPKETQEAYDSGQLFDSYKQDEDLYEWKRLIQTRYLRAKADKLLVQMPSVDDPEMYNQVEWDKDPSEPQYLTDKGIRVLRASIEEETKHRREAVSYWFGIAVGVIGALSGLVSAFK